MSLEVEDNVPDFPREERLLKKRKKHSKLQKTRSAEDDLGSLFGGGINGKLPRFANRITLKNISPGMKLWGVVSEVNDKDIVVSLPGGLRGLVRASEAVPPFLQYVEKLSEMDTNFLSSVYHVGQLVSCIVLHLDDDKKEAGKRKIWLSLHLSSLHKSLTLDVIQEGMENNGMVSTKSERRIEGVVKLSQKMEQKRQFLLNILLRNFNGFDMYISIVNLCGRKRAVINQIGSNFYCRLDLPADKIDRFINIFVQKFNVGDTRFGWSPRSNLPSEKKKEKHANIEQISKALRKSTEAVVKQRKSDNADFARGSTKAHVLAVKVEYAGTRSSCLQLPVINPIQEQKLARAIASSKQEITRVNLESFVTNASIPMHCSVQDLRLPMLLLRCGQILSAYVKSMEDHGYIIHFGLPSFSGFMPKESDLHIYMQSPELPCFIRPYESLKGQVRCFCGFYAAFFGVWMSFLESVFLIKLTLPEVLDDYVEFELEDKLFLREGSNVVGAQYECRSRGRILHDLNLKIWGYGSRCKD
ncbi:hypothetical protein T459_15501 [Capsicum annuum]|uniref:S1 motif domain-containing protein n=1 Tax=Capsicum annuum TaxID=4072 RepID=A0A2G2ZKH5_CAPAN|nr:hypothetical protein T459_15501 [Capsicum annuum]